MLRARDLTEGADFLPAEDIRAEAERGLDRSLAWEHEGLLHGAGLKRSN